MNEVTHSGDEKSNNAVGNNSVKTTTATRDWFVPVFVFNDYREFLCSLIEAQSNIRGIKSRLSEAAKCQPSYFTQVLQSEAHLSLDQLFGISHFLKLKEPEWEYLKELWLFSRAITPELKDSCQKRLAILKAQYGGVVGASDSTHSEEDPEKFNLFGTSWQHGAIYVALAIPHLRTAEALSKKFEVPITRVKQVLSELKEMGLIAENKKQWLKTSRVFTMDRSSTTCQMYRTAWYMKGMQNFFNDPQSGYHAGACFAVNKKRIPELQERTRRIIFELFRDKEEQASDTVIYIGADIFEV